MAVNIGYEFLYSESSERVLARRFLDGNVESEELFNALDGKPITRGKRVEIPNPNNFFQIMPGELLSKLNERRKGYSHLGGLAYRERLNS